jgi:hypothetical protein
LLFERWKGATAERRKAITRALEAAESSVPAFRDGADAKREFELAARVAGSADYAHADAMVALETAPSSAARAAVRAAAARVSVLYACAARIAYAVPSRAEWADGAPSAAASRATVACHSTLIAIWSDYDALLQAARERRWDDDIPVLPSFFGPLWPDGEPEELEEAGAGPLDNPSEQLVVRAHDLEAVPEEEVFSGLLRLLGALGACHIARGGRGLVILDWQVVAPDSGGVTGARSEVILQEKWGRDPEPPADDRERAAAAAASSRIMVEMGRLLAEAEQFARQSEPETLYPSVRRHRWCNAHEETKYLLRKDLVRAKALALRDLVTALQDLRAFGVEVGIEVLDAKPASPPSCPFSIAAGRPNRVLS